MLREYDKFPFLVSLCMVPTSSPHASGVARWELRLSSVSFFSLSILVCSSIVASYYLGFIAGKRVGVEAALDGTVASLPKLPIVPPLREREDEKEDRSDVVHQLDREGHPTAVPTVPLAKDKEGLQPIPEVRIGDAVGGDRKAENPRDALEQVLEERAAAITPTSSPTPVPTVRQGSSERGNVSGVFELLRQGTVPPGWYVQVAAVTTVGEAQVTAAKIKTAGFAVVVEDVKIGKKQYYRVLVGPEGNKEPAQRMVEQVRRERLVKGEPFLRRAK